MSFLLRWSVFALIVAALWCAACAALQYMDTIHAAHGTYDASVAMLRSGRWYLVESVMPHDEMHREMWQHFTLFERLAELAVGCLLLIPALFVFVRQVYAEEQHGR